MEEGLKNVYRAAFNRTPLKSRVYAVSEAPGVMCKFIKIYAWRGKGSGWRVISTLMPVMKVGELTTPVSILKGMFK